MAHSIGDTGYAPPTLFEVSNPFIAVAAAIGIATRCIDHASHSVLFIAAAYIVLTPVFLVAIIAAYLAVSTTHRWFTSRVLRNDPWRDLLEPKGPESTSMLFAILGHIPQIRAQEPILTHLAWAKELKSYVYLYRGLFMQPRVVISDPRGAMHVMSHAHAYDYPKPKELRRYLVGLIGDGLVTSEGDTHRKQRKITAPAFTVQAVRTFMPAFWHHTNNLVQALNNDINATDGPRDEPFLEGQTKYAAQASRKAAPIVDMAYWLSKATLDMIGEIGFGYDFNSINLEDPGKQGAMAEAVYTLLRSLDTMTLIDFIRPYLASKPGLFWLDNVLPAPKRHRQAAAVCAVVDSYANDIIAKKKLAIEQEIAALGLNGKKQLSKKELDEAIASSTPQLGSSAHGDYGNDDDRERAKDLLHLVMRANMAADLKPSDKLSDDELRGSLTSFLMAGHETTATQTLWALWEMAPRTDIIRKLRQEIDDFFGMETTVDYDTLHRMPYLDAVCKEMMRLWTPVSMTMRVAQKDDVVPLGKPYPSKLGGTFQKVVIKKGQEIMMPMAVINRSEDVWGPTAADLNPDRWFDVPQTAIAAGMPLHLMTFLVGPRSCVGQRAAIAEFKVLLSVLTREFDFQRVEDWEMEPKHGIILRPTVKGQDEVGLQMPLRVTRAKGARNRASSLMHGGSGFSKATTSAAGTSGRSSPVKMTTMG